MSPLDMFAVVFQLAAFFYIFHKISMMSVKKVKTELSLIVSNDGLGGYNAWIDEDKHIRSSSKTKNGAIEEVIALVKRDGLSVSVEDLT